MGDYPINLDLAGRPVVVIGGGAVAARKCATLIAAGAKVTVVAPHVDHALRDMLEQGLLTHVAREYRRGDVEGAFLAFAATDDALVNHAVADEAKAQGTLVNIADAPELGASHSPPW